MLLSNKSIFIVEDTAQNRVVFQMALIRHGALVEFERWGPETIARLNNLPPVNLIVLDLMLADGISGLDLFDQIRAIPKYTDIPIVAVSAMDPAIAILKVRERGFSGFIAKPIDRNLFPKQVAELIAGKQIWHLGDRNISS